MTKKADEERQTMVINHKPPTPKLPLKEDQASDGSEQERYKQRGKPEETDRKS